MTLDFIELYWKSKDLGQNINKVKCNVKSEGDGITIYWELSDIQSEVLKLTDRLDVLTKALAEPKTT